MASQRPRRRPGQVVMATLFVVLGALFLLSNFGLLPPDWWRDLWRLWPLLLILIGAEIILGRVGGWGMGLMVLVLAAIALAVGLFVVFRPLDFAGGVRAAERWVEPLGELKEAELSIDVGAGALNVMALPTSSADLIDAELTYDRSSWFGGRLSKSLQRSGAEGRLRLRGGSGANDWNLKLSPNVAWDLTIDAEAVKAELDLGQLATRSLELKVGASDVTVRFPERAGRTIARIKGGVSNLSLEIPSGVAATIRIDSPLSTVDIDEARFMRRDGYYSAGDSAAPNSLELSLDIGVSRVRIR